MKWFWDFKAMLRYGVEKDVCQNWYKVVILIAVSVIGLNAGCC